ncbi:hypothetical protein BKA70DRAFT_1349970 [Coprinopsis sp. MPI-PUGE-AT-0042]|nr:hypothetical protein BKA70DRAFT_1349970 [Coprinopsis sp. MPI-PUGE-AT-0042]
MSLLCAEDIGPARERPSEEVIAEAKAKRGDEEVDPAQFQDPTTNTVTSLEMCMKQTTKRRLGYRSL